MVKRPIINTRDEPHADAARFRRLHVITGDANMAELSTYLKVGTLDIVLDLLESGADLPQFESGRAGSYVQAGVARSGCEGNRETGRWKAHHGSGHPAGVPGRRQGVLCLAGS